jgi:tRNA (guanine37-N1)-methyltransferase
MSASRDASTNRLRFSVVTLFPEMFSLIREEGVVARALEKGRLSLETIFLRDFAQGARRNVDEHPVGGGDGMVLRPDVAAAALESVLQPASYVIHVTPSGKVFNNKIARDLASREHLVLLCGRYAGFDSRLVSRYVHAELSLGDFVLSGGELPALCMIDAVARFIPGVLGNVTSAERDSFEDGLLEAPVYTKPLEWEGMAVPEVLQSGDHKRVEDYRRREQLKLTARNRPDLVQLHWDSLTRSERTLVEKIWKHG